MEPHVFHPERIKVPPLIWAARWFVGYGPFDYHDDATWTLPATRIVKGNPNRALTGPRWHRALRRCSYTLTGTCTFVGLLPGLAVGYWDMFTVGGLWAVTLGGIEGVRAYVNWDTARNEHAATWRERSIADSVSSMTGGQIEAKHVRYATGRVTIALPAGIALNEPFKLRFRDQVAARLGWLAAEADWFTSDATMSVEIRPAATVPDSAPWSEIAPLMAGASMDRPLLGLGTAGPVWMDFVQESPHSMLSAPSGTGKSTLYKMLFAQRLRHGVGLVVLDYKNSSAYDYLDQLPENQVRRYTETETIGEVLLLLLAEFEYRKANRRTSEFGFRTLDVLVEEANSLHIELGLAWKADPERRGPNQWQSALARLVNMGREFGMHLHVAAQRGDAKVFGGGDVRESFQLRLMARQNENTWKMLVPGVPFVPPPRGPIGIWTLSQGQEWAHLRVPYLSDAEAVEFALQGAGEHLGVLTHGVELPRTGESFTMSAETAELLLASEELVSLAEHARATGQNLGALSQRVRRAGVEPVQQGRGRNPALYRPADLS